MILKRVQRPERLLWRNWASSISSVDPKVSYGWRWFLPGSEREKNMKKKVHILNNDVAVLNYRPLQTLLKRSATRDVSCWTKWFCFNKTALFTTRTKDFAGFPSVTIQRKVRNSTHQHPQENGKVRNPMHHFDGDLSYLQFCLFWSLEIGPHRFIETRLCCALAR